MKKALKPAITLFIIPLLISCSGANKHYQEAPEMSFSEYSEIAEASIDESESGAESAKQKENYDGEMQSAVSSSAAKVGKQDSTRKLIRTAELKFKAKNVVQTVYTIEEIAGTHNGFVSYSNLAGERNYVEEIPINKDSTLILTHYTVTNQMVIRVPDVKLDTVLKSIAKQIDFLDYRIIKADDVSLTFRANQLAQSRSKQSAQRVRNAIDNRGRRLNETIDAEDVLYDRQQNADNAWLSNLSLMDQVEYSTVKLFIYQQESILKELIANEKNIDAYQPGFGSRFVDALSWGGNVLLDIILFLVNIWPFILILGIGWWIYKKVKSKK